MTIHTAGENGLAMFLDADDLALLGNTELNENTAKTLVNTTLSDMGLDIGAVEISAFFGKHSAMLVALLGKQRPARRVIYKVLDEDALLDVWKMSEGYERKHYSVGNEHYITFPEDSEPPRMKEFGKRIYRPQLFLTYLEEHDDKQRLDEASA